MDHLVHFEIHADDPARAIAFYNGLFGWTITPAHVDGYWLVSATDEGEPGIDGAIMRRHSARPEIGAPIVGMVTTVQVSDLDKSLERATALGASLAMARQEIPGVGSVAYVHDTEANVVGLFQPLA
jgi:predicted enzyme related to lactoylglutathione lyase